MDKLRRFDGSEWTQIASYTIEHNQPMQSMSNTPRARASFGSPRVQKKKRTARITKNRLDSVDAGRRRHRARDGEDIAARLEEPLHGGGLGPCGGRPSPAPRSSPPLPPESAVTTGPRAHQSRSPVSPWAGAWSYQGSRGRRVLDNGHQVGAGVLEVDGALESFRMEELRFLYSWRRVFYIERYFSAFLLNFLLKYI
jgi:hypothetical protein